MPVVSVSVFVGMVAAVMASILESIGDYFAMAGVCEEPPPPQHAVNRGIAVEGLSSLISGLLGACHATTSYSEVVGMVAMTGVSYFYYCFFLINTHYDHLFMTLSQQANR